MNNCIDIYSIYNNVSHYTYVNCLLYPLMMFFSLYLIFFGNKALKPTIFITGASSSILILHSVSDVLNENNIFSVDNYNCNFIAILYMMFAVLFGYIMLSVYNCSIFTLTAVSGGTITYIGIQYVDKLVSIDNNVKYGLIGLVSLVCGLFGLRTKHNITMLITLVMGTFLNLYSFSKITNIDINTNIEIYTIMGIIISMTGLLVQCHNNNPVPKINGKENLITYT